MMHLLVVKQLIRLCGATVLMAAVGLEQAAPGKKAYVPWEGGGCLMLASGQVIRKSPPDRPEIVSMARPTPLRLEPESNHFLRALWPGADLSRMSP